jgi:hypothetical protein
MVESNTETLAQLRSHDRADAPQVAVLEREITFLKSILPETLDADAIVRALAPVREDIVNAKSDGQATGVAMKHLKSQSLNVQGQDVSVAVKQIRSS